MEWATVSAGDVGMSADGLARVVALVGERRATARLCVLKDGRPVLDRGFGGAPPDALYYLFSTSKPFVALLVHLMARRGVLDLDEPVARYWPEFAAHGKAGVTVRHALTHRAGIPLATRNLVGDVLLVNDWERATRAVARARPRYPAGRVPAYHILSFGFLLGEVLRRVTGRELPELLRTELLAPLGLSGIHLGLPADRWDRAVPLTAAGAVELGRCAFFNRRRTREAVIPAAGVSATGRDLARFYQALLDDEGTVLPPGTMAEATRVSTDGETDRLLRHPVRWGHGFQLGGPPGEGRPTGRAASLETFGHNGSSICNAWADPTRRLVMVYLTNLAVSREEGLRHQCAVSDAVLAACM